MSSGALGAPAGEPSATIPAPLAAGSPVFVPTGTGGTNAAGQVSGTNAAAGPAPGIHFETPSFDCGRMDYTQTVAHTFVFANTGDAPLEILSVQPGCGCTTTGAWDRLVEPGRTGSIPIQLKADNLNGTVLKRVMVHCNDPIRPVVALEIKATIWRPIDVSPDSIYFLVTDSSSAPLSRTIRILNNLAEPLAVSDLVCTNASFRAELKTVIPAREFHVEIAVIPPLASFTAQSTVTLKTSSPLLPLISIPVTAQAQPTVLVLPSRILLPEGPLRSAAQYSVTVRSAGTNLLALSDASINLEGASVAVHELQAGRLFKLSVALPKGVELSPDRAVEAVVKSNQPKHPLIRVPVLSVRRPAGGPTAGRNP